MIFSLLINPRVLVLGLGDPSLGDEGIGVFLARSLRLSLKEADIEEAPREVPDFARIFHNYDLVILLDSISMCGDVGRVMLVSPDVLPDLKGAWVDRARALVRALEDARLHGRRIPKVQVVAVCVPDLETPQGQMSPRIAALYRAVYRRVREVVRQLIREARASSLTMSLHLSP